MFASLSPSAARIGGFLAGVVVPLALAGLVAVAFGGGLSDTPAPPAPVYVIE